ncbi:hypothetical protein GGQ74_003067 [Desulfobaculum xiamenense]|uniref:TIGR01777 family protein n=1 Tax=Desulfobaculum xiamenense TaxID=995050 RepID=A0A846QUY8_9BACT|nr:TIGR01777 family oxidoreductase [Desulfobaculum xiamenense]NJB69365.1 hypothetical protein [Desulfobaculum xiamenense]
MRVIIVGGTGFIGRELCVALLAHGHDVVVTSRCPDRVERLFGGRVGAAAWDGRDPESFARLLDEATQPQVVVNLVGENIANGYWTAAKKRRILDSRVVPGRALARAVAIADGPVAAFVQASAVGYYGYDASADDRPVDENSPKGRGFLADVCEAWEGSVAAVAECGVRLALARTGVVLGPGGGVLERFVPPFRMYLGGPLGSGRQWFPWIHAADEVAALAFLAEREDARGAFNLVSPGVVTMGDFCAGIGRVLGRPSWLGVPGFALRLVLGDMAREVVLASHRAVPARLLEMGFVFGYPDLRVALGNIFND